VARRSSLRCVEFRKMRERKPNDGMGEQSSWRAMLEKK
jgi:hypothetical protein